jgi:hypothetical protein
MPMRWEYHTFKDGTSFWAGKIDEPRLVAEMNSLGMQGWELVATLETNAVQGASNEIVLLFKRPL